MHRARAVIACGLLGKGPARLAPVRRRRGEQAGVMNGPTAVVAAGGRWVQQASTSGQAPEYS